MKTLEIKQVGIESLLVEHRVEVNSFDGTARLNVPVRTSPGREDFGPALMLVYGSGGGNSPFGVGWGLGGMPSIAIDTSKALPIYGTQDRYAFAGGQDLVPVANGAATRDGFRVERWRACVERTYERFERWIELATGRAHWLMYARNGVVSVFGRSLTGDSRVADPADATRTFQWLLERQVHPKGNAIVYDYKSDGAQRYLKRIRYANAAPLDAFSASVPTDWLLDVVFDYGEHESLAARPVYPEVDEWPERVDAFSTFRPGFEVRTRRLCRRILMFHNFAELGPEPSLVGATELEHDENPAGSTVRAIRWRGYRTGEERTTPPVRFTYTQADIAASFEPASLTAVTNVPAGLGGRGMQWVDLLGDGMPGILYEGDGAWYYKENLGDGELGPQMLVGELPRRIAMTLGLWDFDGDGNLDLVALNGRDAGWYCRDRRTGRWGAYQTFTRNAHADWNGSRVQVADLNGDGWPDLIVDLGDRFAWYASEGKDGFSPAVVFAKPDGVPTVRPDLRLSLFFADMNGDGVADIARVQNGRVEYWPHVGHGRFGPGVVMEGAPRIASEGEFNPQRLRLVDLDGSGTADLLYIGSGEVRIWTNQSGNGFGPELRIEGLPYIDDLDSVSIVDFFGDGTRCLVWSSSLPGHAARPMSVLRLGGGAPPRLLASVASSVGQETTVHWQWSGREYLRDKSDGTPWISHIPHHRPVVSSVHSVDHSSGNRGVSRYAYHDGYHDDSERRVVGFGMVDIWDAESAAGDAEETYSTPSRIRTFYETGQVYAAGDRRHGTWSADPLHALLPPPTLVDETTWSTREYEDGYRALAGLVRRQEIFADGALHPLRVSQTTYLVRRLQSEDGEMRAALAVEESERVAHEYEGQPDDARVVHELVLVTDAYGSVEARATIGYPRRIPDAPPEQRALQGLAVIRRHRSVDEPQRFETAVVIEEEQFALSLDNAGGQILLSRADVAAALPTATRAGWERVFYWNDDRSAPRPLGQFGAVTLVHHVERALFSAADVQDIYGQRVTTAMLVDDARVFERDGLFWAADVRYDYLGADRFFRLLREVHRGGGESTYSFDQHALVLVGTVDPAGGATTATVDYQALAVETITDSNANVRETRYDALGVAILGAVRGQILGADSAIHPIGAAPLADHVPLPNATWDDILADPEGALQGAGQLLFYDLDTWERGDGPPRFVELLREEHFFDGEGGTRPDARVSVRVSYPYAFGQSAQLRIRADEGWRVSGLEVRNNKGFVVRRFEPFMSSSPGFALEEGGVSAVVHVDAVGREVQADLPNGSRTRVEYSPWRTVRHDANDAVAGSRYETERLALAPTDPQRLALMRALAHAETPLVEELDSLGRPFRVTEIGEGATSRITHVALDSRGFPIRRTDERGLVAIEYRRDMLGRPLHVKTHDAGDVWTLLDDEGRPIHRWDARGDHTEVQYDEAGRRIEVMRGGRVVERFEYGEDPTRNVRGRLVRQHDQAGVLEIERYGIMEQALGVSRRLCADYAAEPDWTDPTIVALDPDLYRTTYRVDALERVVQSRLGDGTSLAFAYDRAGHIGSLRVTTADGAITDRAFVESAEYNARGQRTRVRFGNGTETTWSFDDLTHRLARITTRSAEGPPRTWLDVAYAHDPAGNLVEWIDHAQEPGGTTALISGLTVSSVCRFTYDAYYRLVEATGRVHQALLPHDVADRHLSLNNGAAVERYVQTYSYDAAGNITRLRHQGATQSWTTDFWISPTSNRSLHALDANGNPVVNPEAAFDAIGNCVRLDHLRALHWDDGGRLSHATVIDRSAQGQPDDAEHYRYDAEGERVRRVTERLVAGQIEVTETVYLPGCEIHRVHRGGNTSLRRTTAHVSDGVARIATLHQWTVDTLARETDDVSRKKVHYQVSNHLGSVSLELDADARVVGYEEYFPFGGTSFIAGDDLRDFRLKEIRYSGKVRDDATGFHYYGFRYLAPSMCRWISPDPAGPVDGLNLYQFVRNNPIRYVDADGLQTDEVTLHLGSLSAFVKENDDAVRAALTRAIHGTTHKVGGFRVRLKGTVVWNEAKKQNVFIEEPGTREIVGPISLEEWSESEGAEVYDAESLGLLIGNLAPSLSGGGNDLQEGGGSVNAWGKGEGAGAGGGDPFAVGKGEKGSETGGGESDESKGSGTGADPLSSSDAKSAGSGQPEGTGTSDAKGKKAAPGAKSGKGKEPGTGTRKKGDPGGRKGGSPGGTAGGVIGGSDDGVLGAPLAPEWFPTGADGVEYGGEALPSGPYEIGDVTRPGTGAAESGSSGLGSGEGEGQGGKGGSGGSPEGSEGGRPDGSTRGINIGGGTIELPQWLDTALDKSLDTIQLGLDVVGLIPLVGEIADGVNGLISLFRGDAVGAGLSFAAMIPIAGWGATGAKFGLKGTKALGIGVDVGKAALKNSDEAAGAATRTRRKFSEWVWWGGDQGGVTKFIPIPGSKNFQTVVQNLDTPGTWAFRDTAAHEGFHALIGRHAGWITSAGDFTIRGIPVGAPIKWAEETLAYAIGHANALRLHAIPLAPLEAFGSMSGKEALFTLGTFASGIGAYFGFRRESTP